MFTLCAAVPEHGHAVGLRLLYTFRKLTVLSQTLAFTGSLPHTVHLTYEEFLLVSLSLGI
jgi:hypothetical protein